MNGIGILPGYRLSYVDHLVPLCQTLEIPLVVTEPWIQQLIECYYPPMDVRLAQPEDYCLDEALAGYDFFVYVDYYRLAHGTFRFAEYFSTHKARSVISLHGQPDKWLNIYWLEQLMDEDIILAYGPRLLEIFQKKGIDKEPVICGNYRLEFYEKNRSFLEAHLPALDKKRGKILYAPTWSSPQKKSEFRLGYSPFFEACERLFKAIPHEDYQLIVKLHPHLIYLQPDEVRRVKEQNPEICFLDDFPLIYPLLQHIDIFVGDYSSLGNDFLFFNRPLFFVGPPSETFLHSQGRCLALDNLDQLGDLFKQTPPFQDNRVAYRAIYGEKIGLATLKETIHHALRSLPQRK